MKALNGTRITLTALAALLTTACGSGGSVSTAGIDRTGGPPSATAFGTVTGFGSIIVNGVRYETSGASFTIDGQPGTEDSLGVGDVVLVNGSISSGGATGTATRVTFDDSVEGPIDFIDPAGTFLIVMGQTVRLGPDTSYDDSIQPSSVAGLMEEDVVEVSGLVDSIGEIGATRLEAKPAGGELEVTGVVSNINGVNSRFMINDLVVDFSGASVRDFPSGSINDDDLVEAKGTAYDSASRELIATDVEFKGSRLGGAAGDHAEIEGFITGFSSPTSFEVSGFPVTTNGQTRFEGGDANDLGPDLKVEVEGELDGSDVLVADKVDIRRARVIRIEAAVDSVQPDPADSRLGRLLVLGITVTVDALTRMEDKTNQDVEPFGLADLADGEFVVIRGTEFPAGSGEVLAGLLEREDPGETSIQGFVSSAARPSFSILGVTVDTNGGTEFRDLNDSVISADDFFGPDLAGSLVKARGVEAADRVVAADRVELELER